MIDLASSRHQELWALLAHHYPGIGTLLRLDSAIGGTASRNDALETTSGRYFLRRRNPRYAAEEVVAFDHLLMEHLAAHGLPVVLACEVDGVPGRRWLRVGPTDVLELYPWCSGHVFDRSRPEQLRAAGHMLGQFHAATRHFHGPPGKAWPRYDSPEAIIAGLHKAAAGPVNAVQRDLLAYLLQQTRDLAATLSDETYQALPMTVIHGDYHPGNVLFRDDRVAGIFDLDWATRQPRLRDLADGVLFFAAQRATDIQPDDITSLTQTPWLDAARAWSFIQAYTAASDWPLEPVEIAVLAQFVRARWLYCRVDGMRKIPEQERLTYLLNGVADPLQWLVAHAAELTSRPAASPLLSSPREYPEDML